MAPKRRLPSNTSLASAPSSDEDSFSALKVVQSPTKNPLAPAPADQESDDEMGAGDEVEIGDNGVLTERQPPPKRMAAAELPNKNVAPPETSAQKSKVAKSPLRKKKGDAAAPAAEIVRPPPLTRDATAAQLARSPSPEKDATAAASDAVKSPLPKKGAVAAMTRAANSPRPKKAAARAEIAGTPPSTVPADEMREAAAPAEAEKDLPQPQEGEYDAEKHFKQKSQAYWYLWQMVLTLEEEHSISFKGAFLKIADAKASTLNTKLKKMCVQEMKQQLRWMDTHKKVTKVLVDLIK